MVKVGKVKRLRRGRPKQRAERMQSKRSRYLVGDKAYSSGKIRQQLHRQVTTPVIPKPSNEKRRGGQPATKLGSATTWSV